VLHEKELIDNIYKFLKMLFYIVVISTFIKCSACVKKNIF
jgi:hypothetical protein